MATLRKTMKKTLIETDITKRLLEALTEHEPKDIINFMAKNTPRTLADTIKRMEVAAKPAPTETYAPGEPKGRSDWTDLKDALEDMYMTGDFTREDLIEHAIGMADGEIDRYTASMLVDEIFEG